MATHDLGDAVEIRIRVNGTGIAPIELVPQDVTRVLLNLIGNGFYAATKRDKEGGDPKFKPTLKVATLDLGEAVEILEEVSVVNWPQVCLQALTRSGPDPYCAVSLM